MCSRASYRDLKDGLRRSEAPAQGVRRLAHALFISRYPTRAEAPPDLGGARALAAENRPKVDAGPSAFSLSEAQPSVMDRMLAGARISMPNRRPGRGPIDACGGHLADRAPIRERPCRARARSARSRCWRALFSEVAAPSGGLRRISRAGLEPPRAKRCWRTRRALTARVVDAMPSRSAEFPDVQTGSWALLVNRSRDGDLARSFASHGRRTLGVILEASARGDFAGSLFEWPKDRAARFPPSLWGRHGYCWLRSPRKFVSCTDSITTTDYISCNYDMKQKQDVWHYPLPVLPHSGRERCALLCQWQLASVHAEIPRLGGELQNAHPPLSSASSRFPRRHHHSRSRRYRHDHAWVERWRCGCPHARADELAAAIGPHDLGGGPEPGMMRLRGPGPWR